MKFSFCIVWQIYRANQYKQLHTILRCEGRQSTIYIQGRNIIILNNNNMDKLYFREFLYDGLALNHQASIKARWSRGTASAGQPSRRFKSHFWFHLSAELFICLLLALCLLQKTKRPLNSYLFSPLDS